MCIHRCRYVHNCVVFSSNVENGLHTFYLHMLRVACAVCTQASHTRCAVLLAYDEPLSVDLSPGLSEGKRVIRVLGVDLNAFLLCVCWSFSGLESQIN